MKLFRFSCVLIALVLLSASAPDKTTTIFIIGDSTAANKDLSKGKQERGWGMALQRYFDENVIVVDNHAVNGRSSKSFMDEGRWDKVLEKIKPGDYVIIQFGHNDEKAQPNRHTDPGSTFDYNLAKYVRETREHGGIPVLMNAVVRRNFLVQAPAVADDEMLRNTTFADGSRMVEGDSLIDTHGLYRETPRDVARRRSRGWGARARRNSTCGSSLVPSPPSRRASRTTPITMSMVPRSWPSCWPMPSARKSLCSRPIVPTPRLM